MAWELLVIGARALPRRAVPLVNVRSGAYEYRAGPDIPQIQTTCGTFMNNELTADVASDLTELTHPSASSGEERTDARELPFYIVPAPPIPGKTAWSIAPW